MPSIVPGFEYDIFISYRHNDNRSGWVTEFVKASQEELAATIKESLTIYFDRNPHDGLLETHNVDKSLEGKLKCIIFIPIISQTYCDPKSFAWQHEFCVFNTLAKEDPLGRDIKLTSGNVTSRILPIKIHDLDAEDKAIIENEIGGVLRAIDFIYKEAGVNRPLRLNEDNPNKNQNQTTYRNQVNKVANAIKDIIAGMKNPGTNVKENKKTEPTVSPSFRKKTALIASVLIVLGITFAWYYYRAGWGETLASVQSKSIAVLPFENMNRDSTQDYFSNGIAEDILNHLVKISDLEVKSRTSTLQYKGTTKTAPVIGAELGVSNILEGSVRRVGNQVRIVVQLIDAKNDRHLWSETYDRDFKDVLALQSEIAIEISRALEAKLTAGERKNIEKEITQNATAYDYYLQAREKYSKSSGSREEIESVMDLINKAVELDPTFSKAYAYKGRLWYNLSTFGLTQKTWEDSVFLNTTKSIRLDPQSSDAYLVQSWVHGYLGRLAMATDNLGMAYRLNPNDLDVQRNYGYALLHGGDENGADMVLKSIERNYSTKQTEYYQSFVGPLMEIEDYDGAAKMVNEAIKHGANSSGYYGFFAYVYAQTGQYDKALQAAEQNLNNNPKSHWAIDRLAWSYFYKKDYKKAAEYWSKYPEIEAGFEDKTQTVPFRHRLAMTLMKLGDNEKAKELLLEEVKIQNQILEKIRGKGAWDGIGGDYYALAVDKGLLGFETEATQYLDSAFKYGFSEKWLFGNDPAFEKIKSLPSFRKVQEKVEAYHAFRKRAFTNALNRAQASKELKGLLDR